MPEKLRELEYSDLFFDVYGPDALSEPALALSHMADAIAAFEMTEEFRPFTSKYDYFLQGKGELTEQEIRGMALFVSERKGNCAARHPITVSEDGNSTLFRISAMIIWAHRKIRKITFMPCLLI